MATAGKRRLLRPTFVTGLLQMGEHSEIVEFCIGYVQQGIRATY
jgi:hypothetical protein